MRMWLIVDCCGLGFGGGCSHFIVAMAACPEFGVRNSGKEWS